MRPARIRGAIKMPNVGCASGLRWRNHSARWLGVGSLLLSASITAGVILTDTPIDELAIMMTNWTVVIDARLMLSCYGLSTLRDVTMTRLPCREQTSYITRSF